MKLWSEILLDEKIIFCGMALILSLIAVVLIKWGVEKDYIMQFVGFVGMLLGALLRGITHQPQKTDSTQTVQSVTTIEPKE